MGFKAREGTENMRFAHFAQRVFNRPAMILPEKAEIIVAALRQRLGVGDIVNPASRPMAWYDDDDYAPPPAPDHYYTLIEGVAVIPVADTLVQKLGSMTPYSGMTGYDGIAANFVQALADPNVKGIMLDIDSPGGEVAGCFDLVDMISAAKGTKPIRAMLSERAFSAAYAIASAADLITVPRTGGTGSVGVITMHVDMSAALAKEGYTVTLITNGARKAEGNPYEPLKADALSAIQADIDAVGAIFAGTVAANRGMTVKAVQATEAATYLGQAGVDIGFADAVAAPEIALRAFIESVN
jgi:ClpP class serine protease